MTTKELFARCRRHAKAPIKAVLLDQKVIAGLGNICADESLFMQACIRRRRRGVNRRTGGVDFGGARSVMMESD